MTTEHTPGPWVVQISEHYPDVRHYFRPDHYMVVTGAVHGYMYAPDERANQEANARLIAAAPDMLSALQNITRALQDECGETPVYPDSALAGCIHAIEKATGA